MIKKVGKIKAHKKNTFKADDFLVFKLLVISYAQFWVTKNPLKYKWAETMFIKKEINILYKNYY